MNLSAPTPHLARRHDLHVARKLWHICTGLTGLVVYFSAELTPLFTAQALLAVALIGFTVDIVRLRVAAINRICLRLMGPLMRQSEAHSMSGLPFYALGVSLSLFLYPEKLAILGILFLIFADPIASFVGILYGRDRIVGSKSYQGTYGSFVACFVLSLVYGLYYAEPTFNLLIFSFFGAIVGCLSEAISTKIDDNLTIPVLSGAGLIFLHQFIPVF
jgi:diacylglycerol kinase (CTP)